MPIVQRELVRARASTSRTRSSSTRSAARAGRASSRARYSHTPRRLREPGAVRRLQDLPGRDARSRPRSRRAGYETGWFGKYLNGYSRHLRAARLVALGRVLAGVRREPLLRRHPERRRDARPLHRRRRATRPTSSPAMAADFITGGRRARCSSCSPPPRRTLPRSRRRATTGAFAGMAPWRPPSYNEADISDKPAFARTRPLWDAARRATEDAFHEDQLETLLAVDDAVGSSSTRSRTPAGMDDTLFVYHLRQRALLGREPLELEVRRGRGVDPRPARRPLRPAGRQPARGGRGSRSTSTSRRRSPTWPASRSRPRAQPRSRSSPATRCPGGATSSSSTWARSPRRTARSGARA